MRLISTLVALFTHKIIFFLLHKIAQKQVSPFTAKRKARHATDEEATRMQSLQPKQRTQDGRTKETNNTQDNNKINKLTLDKENKTRRFPLSTLDLRRRFSRRCRHQTQKQNTPSVPISISPPRYSPFKQSKYK